MLKNIWLMLREQVRNDLDFGDDYFSPWDCFYWGKYEAWRSHIQSPWIASPLAKQLQNEDIPF